MEIRSNIEWTTFTWNPWTGCNHVSHACDFCYAERTIQGRFGRDFKNVKESQRGTFRKPLRIHKEIAADAPLHERLVFTCSWSDFFHKQADPLRERAWEIIRQCPNLVFQILTKRPERIMQCLPADWGSGYENVWIGTTVEDQQAADLRIPILAQVPAVVRFLSVEPMLGPVYFTAENGLFNTVRQNIDWIILGGESGNDTGPYRYRPTDWLWYSSVINYCRNHDVPVFMKQLGTHLAKQFNLADRHGGKMEQWPEQLSLLKIRQFPDPAKRIIQPLSL